MSWLACRESPESVLLSAKAGDRGAGLEGDGKQSGGGVPAACTQGG